MRPRTPDDSPSPDLFRNRLENMLDQRHELFRLADLIDWQGFDAEFGELYCAAHAVAESSQASQPFV